MKREEDPNFLKAESKGLKTYRPTKPCIRGHRSLRYVSSHRCLECDALMRTAEQRCISNKRYREKRKYQYANQQNT